MSNHDDVSLGQRWAVWRFGIVGPLLAKPPETGELSQCLSELSDKEYKHPITQKPICVGKSSIERWYYKIRNAPDPLKVLARRSNVNAGQHPSIGADLALVIKEQYEDHPCWSYQLHFDNFETLKKENAFVSPLPGYATVRRYMKGHGYYKRKRLKHQRFRNGDTEKAIEHESRETRSYEVTHVHALWHLDFHTCSRSVLLANGEWKKPHLLGIIDDHSRLCCHLQWYLDETAESLIHGFCQGLQKRGLPRSAIFDNGSAMEAAEFTEGLSRLSIIAYNTLPYSPEQNAKQEVFWAQVEGRLMAMLDGHKELTLSLLNEATQAWVELEYHRAHHREIGTTPYDRYINAKNVGRPCPDSEDLRRIFKTQITRTLRRSDGTITVEGVRFEVPSRYHTIARPCVRVARWDLSSINLVDQRSGEFLARLLPIDKAKNADRKRRIIADLGNADALKTKAEVGIAPKLRAYMSEYAATGLPPAYLPKHDATKIFSLNEEEQ